MAQSETSRDTAKCFVPEMLVDFIDRNVLNGKEGLEPSSFFMHGVCLLVDISGFTKLSGEFCELGKGGIDELQLATNGFMGNLVEVIYMFGGEIIKFAGDAIICIFSSNFVTGVSTRVKGGSKLRRTMSSSTNLLFGDEKSFVQKDKGSADLPTVTTAVILRAMHCAAVLRDVQTEKLTVHVAMSCGEMCFGILGGVENRWECLISGPCIHELSDCLDDAPSKTAVISAECGRIVVQSTNERILEESSGLGSARVATFQADPATKYEFELLQLPSGNHRIVSVKCSAGVESKVVLQADRSAAELVNERQKGKALNLIRQFVPIPVANAIDNGLGLQFIAEIREVTTMFMKWDSYDSNGKHRDLLSLQTAFYRAQEALQSTGAYLRQFLVDDKGCVLIACWGMPHLSYLDNASRALSAAARIRSQLSELHMVCSFGITTGDVYCGTVGSALRMEYAAIGSVVNMAARLMGKAHGGILIDDATHARLAPDLKGLTKALEPIKVKGREEPLPVFSYDSIEMVHVKEKVVEDHEISAACREALLHLVAQLNVADDVSHHQASPVKQQGSQKSMMGWFSGSDKSSVSISTHRTLPPLRLVIIKGKEGSGRTTAVRWLHHKAQERRIPAYTVRISRKDCMNEFFLWKRLFQLMVPKNIFVSNDAQRAYVKTLLDEIYPGNPHQAHHTGFPLLRSILGITCTFTSAVEEGQSHKLVGWLRKDGSDKLQQVHDFLYRVFAYLLKARPSLLIVENVENAHDLSLKLLVEVVKLNVHAGIVLTALEDASGAEAAARKVTAYQERVTYRWEILTRSSWSKTGKRLFESRKATVTVTLENFSPAEIDRMLCATLKVQTVPPEISQLVQDFSGGSYFWVREILQFITDFGAQQFMAAVDEDETATTASDMSTRAFMKPKLKPSLSMSGGQMGAPMHRSLSKAPSQRQLGKTPSFRTPISKKATEASHLTHLNKLVLVRFGNLSTDEQRVLRTASIIGVDFSLVVLRKLLAEQLRESLVDCLETLLNQRWIYQDPEREVLYQFAHPHAHRIIYDLTPSSERVLLHQQVADHSELLFKNDKTQYARLVFQYQQCKSDKALAYLVMAFRDLLQATAIYDFSECLDLLTGAVPCCKSVENADALMKLLDRAEARIRAFSVDEQKSWVGRTLAALTSCGGCRSENPGAVVPIRGADSFSPDAVMEEPALPEGQQAEEQCSYEERVKRIFLLQLAELSAQLATVRAGFAWVGSDI